MVYIICNLVSEVEFVKKKSLYTWHVAAKQVKFLSKTDKIRFAHYRIWRQIDIIGYFNGSTSSKFVSASFKSFLLVQNAFLCDRFALIALI